VTAILQQAGLKVAPTGIRFGTVTAVGEGFHVEITTLRADIKTDGRHAEVAYTTDWALDASRRDFTMNGLTRDLAGRVYDSVGGIEDIQAGRVRFIGDARARIAEDYLRILRYFRFIAWYARVPADVAECDACRAAAANLKELSRERVWAELKKLLSAPNPSDAWMLMLKYGIVPQLLPEAENLPVLCNLLSYEHMRAGKPAAPNPLLRLAALLAGKKIDSEDLKTRFACSHLEAENLRQYLANPLVYGGDSGGQFSTANLSFALHRYGFDLTQDFMLLAQACGAHFDWESARPMLDKWVPKILPLMGEDLLALGLAPGPRIGEILRDVEAWWVAENFRPDHAACMEKAKSLIKV
jgi:poly(A) polymerase